MRVVTDSDVIELGTVETTPTIGIIDYSRRVTDDYGVTTVVKRGFARRMSVRLAVPFEDVDAIQRRLADLRATSATWIADDRYGSLTVRGFYKEFEVDHAIPPLSYCTLTVEGLTGEAEFVDDGSDPAPAGQPSTLQVLEPIAITGPVLASSSVAEDDAAEWSAVAGYAIGKRVIKAATHRVYESLIANNVGNDPAATTGAWLDIGPTNRWAMFDQALGSVTTASEPIAVTLRPGAAVSGLAILDTTAATVRAQASGYDRTVAVTDGAGSALFLDLAAAAGDSITVTFTPLGKGAQIRPWDDRATWEDSVTWRDTIGGTSTAEPPSWDDAGGWRDTTGWQDTRIGDGTVSIGTLMVGRLRPLGITEGSPTSGITDFSRRETDDFGEVAIVPRAWAKRMAAKALIRTDAVDQVVGRIAAVRAVPSLWFADASIDSLTVYGFFKDFSIDVGETLSMLALSIEGFSAAATPAPLTIPWTNVTDPDGTKPAPNADNTGTNTSKDTKAVGGVPAGQILGDAASVKRRAEILENETIPAVNRAVAAADAAIIAARGEAAAAVDAANQKIEALSASTDVAVAKANTRIDTAMSDLAKESTRSTLAIGKANVRIDQAMSDLADEAGRAQGKEELLDRRIDAITVKTDANDAEVRALLATERTVRSDADRAIGQRIDTVTTDYVARDTATNTRITTTETALSSADRALGERIDTVTTDYKGLDSATNTRITQQVSALSEADAAIGRRVDSVVTKVNDNDSATRSEISRVELASSTRDEALGHRVDTVTADYKGRDAATNTRITDQVTALSNADAALGQRIDSVTTDYVGRDAATNTRISTAETALSNADRALGERIDTVTTDYKGRDTATNTRITQQVSALSEADAAIGRRVDSVVTQLTTTDTNVRAEIGRVELASSTRDEALGQRIDTVTADYKGRDAATNTRITDQVTALSNADVALGQRIDSVTTDYVGRDAATNTRITQQVRALSDADAAIGSRIDSIIARNDTGSQQTRSEIQQAATAAANANQAVADLATSVSSRFGGVNTTLGSYDQRITTLANAQQAFGQRIDTLDAVARGGGNLVINSALSTLDGWAVSFNQDNATSFSLNAAGTTWMIGGVENNLSLHRSAAGNGLVCEVQSARFAVRPGSTIQFYALTASHRSNAWVSLFFWRGDGSSGGYAGEHMSGPITGGQSIQSWDMTGVQALRIPDDVVAATFVFRQYNVSGDGYAWMSRPFATEVQPGTNTWVPYAPGNDRAVTSSVASRVSNAEAVLADLPNRYAAASRTTVLEAQVNLQAGSPLNDKIGAVDGRINPLNDRIGAVDGRIDTTAQLLTARIEERATAIADAKVGAVTQTVSQLRSEYNGTAATVSQQAGAIVDLQGRATAYVRLLADAGNGIARLSLWSDQFGGAWELIGNGRIGGDLVVDGTITSTKMGASSVQQTMFLSLNGSMSIPYG